MITLPTNESNSVTWIAYYNSLKKEFGEDNAKNQFYYVWEQRKNDNLFTDSIFTAFVIANDLKIGKFAKVISATSSTSPLKTVLIVGVIGVGVLWVSTLFRATNIIFGFAKQITPDQVVAETKHIADIKSGGLMSLFKRRN